MMLEPKGLEPLASARQKYRSELSRVILALLGRRFDIEDDMLALEKRYETKFPTTPLVLRVKMRDDGYIAGLYWGQVIRRACTGKGGGGGDKQPFIRHLKGGLKDSAIFHIARKAAAAPKYRAIARKAAALNEARKPVMHALAAIQRILRSRYQPVEGMPGGPSLIREGYIRRVSEGFADACECVLGLIEGLAQAEVRLLDLTRRYQDDPADPGWALLFLGRRKPWSVAIVQWELTVGSKIVSRGRLTDRELRKLKIGKKARKAVLAWERERRRVELGRKRLLSSFKRIMRLGREAVWPKGRLSA